MATSGPNVDLHPDGDDPLTLCPACGYDLRATTGDRCSECGLAIDRAAARDSGFPWAHRRAIGRVRAYARTVWQVTLHSRALAWETRRPQDPQDGRAFRRTTIGLLAAALLGTWVWLVTMIAIAMGSGAVPSSTPAPASSLWGLASSWHADLSIPWLAGVTLPCVVPVALVLLAAYLAGVQRAVFRVRTLPAEHQRRAGVIAQYAAAPLTLLLPVPVCLALASVAGGVLKVHLISAPLAVAAALLILLAPGLTLLRVAQWSRRVKRGGTGADIPAALELAGLWLLGLALILGVVPWSLGFFWLVIDSFR